ncbi:MAG: hypothetical protein B6241_09530 [Spirochaetaceae bacterium 4572_59]|nr:MAG: hypothetical protein B6241_09530 [Spirochaetaceae bacterium 4572_59]
MKKTLFQFFLMLLIFSCDISDSEEDKNGLFLTVDYSGDYEIDSATYTLKSLTSNEQMSGSMDCDSETKTVSATLDIPAGYWDARVQLVHNYEETSMTGFAVTTDKRQFYVSQSGDNSQNLPDPFRGNYNGLQAEADVFEMTNVGYPADSARVELFSLDSSDYYIFPLETVSLTLRSGDFSPIKKGSYILRMEAENNTHSDWADNPWHPGLTITTPFELIQFDDDDGSYKSINRYLRGWYYLNDSSWDSKDANYDDDLFYPHTDNGSVVNYPGGGIVEMTANGTDNPATFSLEKLPVGDNRFISLDLYYDSPQTGEETIPLFKMYLKKDSQDMETGIEVEFYSDHIIARARVKGSEKTYFDELYTIDPGAVKSMNVFIRDDLLRFYFDGNQDSTFEAPVDPEIPDDLFLHFETRRTTTIKLSNMIIINNFDMSPVLNYP